MPKYFPFHPETGSQTSNSICESGVGVATACTRQKAGAFLYISLPRPSGDWNTPAATVDAVIAVSFNLSDARFSQSPAKAAEIDRAQIRSFIGTT
jgi:hypothetical protein